MKRIGLLSIVIIFTSLVFIVRLFYLQVVSNEYSVHPLKNSAVKVTYDYPERGYVFDRNGVLLIANQLSYDVMVIPREVKPLDTLDFCKLLKITKEDFRQKMDRARRYSTRIPSTFVAQLSKDDFAFLQEKLYKFKVAVSTCMVYDIIWSKSFSHAYLCWKT